MPLLDHFHSPLSQERHWDGFHSKWANVLVDELNENLLPPGYFAEPTVHLGPRVEVDVATLTRSAGSAGVRNGPAATRSAPAWAPAAATLILPATFPEAIEVQILNTETGPTLVAAIELVSPANKDRAETRRAFALKCASYLCQGISLIIIDVVTSRHTNLHDEIVRLLPESAAFLFPASPFLYAAAYRTVSGADREHIETWLVPLAVGEPLPVLPLALSSAVCLRIDLESTYREACRKLRFSV